MRMGACTSDFEHAYRMKDKADKNITHKQKHRKSADQAPLDPSERAERKKFREAKR